MQVIAGFAAIIAVASHETQAQDRSVDQLFDKPLHKQILPVPANPTEHEKGTLTCFYYPYLMIKEAYYEDHKGAGMLSITNLRKEKDTPACQFDRAMDERKIQDWEGHFLGVKDSYVFFGGSDGDGSGIPFAVYTNNGDRVFSDSGVLHSIKLTEPVPNRDLEHWYTNPLLLRYRRSFLAPCSLRADDEKACWNSVRGLTGLTQTTPPDCGAAYEPYEKVAPSQVNSVRNGPSFIDYDVETALDDRGVIRVTPIGSARKCYPAP